MKLDDDLAQVARDHPVAALTGAVLLGAAAGLLLTARPIRHLAKSASIVILSPLIGDLAQRLLRVSLVEVGEERVPSDMNDLPVEPQA